MYYIVIWQLHTLWDDHQEKPSNHTKLLKYYWPYTLCCILPPPAYLFSNWWFVSLNSLLYYVHCIPFHFFNHLFVLCFYESVFILLCFLCCFLGSSHKWDHMIFVFFCVTYLTKHLIYFRLICVVQLVDFIPFKAE